MNTRKTRREPGIDVRHARTCRTHDGGRCNCGPTYRGHVWSARESKQIRGPSFPTLAQAKNWRQDALVAVRRGTMRAPSPTTVREAAEALIGGMADGSILDRSGKPYKPSTRRSYTQAIHSYVVPRLGDNRLSAVRRRDVQDFVDSMRTAGLAPATIHNKLDPLRVIFRRAIRRDELTVDPTADLDLPSVRGQRDRIESPERAHALIDALPEAERAFWALALFAGLRRGELRGLRWADVDFEDNAVRVEQGWDDHEGAIAAKSVAGRRAVPLAGRVRRELAAHKLRTGRSGGDLVLGRTPQLPFVPSTIRSRARRAWVAAGLDPLTPHEGRHCAVSYFIGCGHDWKQVSVWAGHGDVRQTWNRYGKVVPGSEREAAAKLDAYLERRAT